MIRQTTTTVYSRTIVRTQPVAESCSKPVNNKILADYLRRKLTGRSAGPTPRRILDSMTDAELVEEYRLHEEEKSAHVVRVNS